MCNSCQVIDLTKFSPALPYYRTRSGKIARVAAVDQKASQFAAAAGWINGDMASWGVKGNWGRDQSDSDLVEHLPKCTGYDWIAPVELNQSNWQPYVGKIVEVGDKENRKLVTYYNQRFYCEDRYGDAGLLYGWKTARTCQDSGKQTRKNQAGASA